MRASTRSLALELTYNTHAKCIISHTAPPLASTTSIDFGILSECVTSVAWRGMIYDIDLMRRSVVRGKKKGFFMKGVSGDL